MKKWLAVLLFASCAWSQSINPKQVKPGTFQNGLYTFPGGITAASIGACNWSAPDLVPCFGAKGDGITDDTAAIRAGVVYSETHAVPLHVPALTYSIVPADDWSTWEGGPSIVYKGAFPIASNLDIEADPGATFRIANGVSTAAAPVPMTMFYTSAVGSNVTIRNLTMDMNGQNNRIGYGGAPVTVTGVNCGGGSCTITADNPWVYSASAPQYVHLWGLTSTAGLSLNGIGARITAATSTSFTFATALTGVGVETVGQAELLTRYNSPAIMVGGSVNGAGQLPTAALSNVVLDHDTFINGTGVSSVVMALSNVDGAVLGSGWTISNSTFHNNGFDSDDHSSVFGWADNVTLDNNTFENGAVWGISTLTGTPTFAGGHVCYEIHGANQHITNNTFSRYAQGLWVSDNKTSDVRGILIDHNAFRNLGTGLGVYHTSSSGHPIADVLIENNYFLFDANNIAASPKVTSKYAVLLAPVREITGVTVRNNVLTQLPGSALFSYFVDLSAPTVAGLTTSDITISHNTASGISNGILIAANVGNLGTVTATFNNWLDLTPVGAGFAIGTYVRALGASGNAIANLTLGGGLFTNTQSTPVTTYGTRIEGTNDLTITNLSLLPTTYVGMATGNYTEVASPTITNRIAPMGAGSTVVYRCAAAGAVLPVGALTIATGDCGVSPAPVDTGMRVQ